MTNCARNECSKLTTEALLDNIDFPKLCQAEVGQILGTMIKHIPPLLQHSTALGEAYATKWAIHPIQPTRSQIHPLGTTSIDELKTEGNRDVLYDSFLTQIQLCKDNVQSTLFLVTGDQLSIQHLRTLIITTAKDVISFSQHLWFVPLIVFWHMKWAFQQCVMHVSWFSSQAGGVHGLAQDASILCQNLNPIKCNFYPTHRLIEISFHVHVLTALR